MSPSSNLDGEGVRELRDILRRLKAAGKTVLVAEHRLWYAADLADRVFYLREGQLEQIYTGAEFPGFAGREKALHGSAEFDGGAAAGAAPNSGNGRSDGTRPSGFLRRQSSLAGCVLYRATGADHSHYRSQRGGQDHFGPVPVRFDERAGRDDPVGGSLLGRKERRRRAFLIMQDVNLQLFGDSVLAEARLGSTATEQEALAAWSRWIWSSTPSAPVGALRRAEAASGPLWTAASAERNC